MRVALAIQHFPPYPGGAEQQARVLAAHLAARLGQCDVVTSRHAPALPRESRDGGVRVVRLPTFRRGRARLVANAAMACVHFALHGGRYDVVHAHCLSPFVLGAVLGARLRGCRTLVKICTVGCGGDIAKVRASPLGPWLWRAFRTADALIATSAEVRNEALQAGAAPTRVVLVPNAIDLPRPPRADGTADDAPPAERRTALGLPGGGICLFVGRWVRGKGLDAIMSAWPAIRAAANATLVIVGDGPLRDTLEEWARSPSVAGSVRLIGWQSDPSPYYRAADVLLAPSASEAFGNVLAEAMAHGLAAITTPVGLAAAHVRDGENGVLLHARQPEALAPELAHATLGLLADEPLRRRIGEQARATARFRFGSDAVLDVYTSLYRRLLAGGAPSDTPQPLPSPSP